jgi:hypothetical protein
VKTDQFAERYKKLRALATMVDAAAQDYIPPFRAPEKIVIERTKMRTAARQDLQQAFEDLVRHHELSMEQIAALGEITIQSPSPQLADEAIKISVMGPQSGFFSASEWNQPDVLFARGLRGQAGYRAKCVSQQYLPIMLERPKTTKS